MDWLTIVFLILILEPSADELREPKDDDES